MNALRALTQVGLSSRRIPYTAGMTAAPFLHSRCPFRHFVTIAAKIAIVLALGLTCASSADALTLLGTIGSDEDASTLVELNPATGAIVRTIGPVSYTVNGMTYDPSTGILYGTTGFESPILGNALITIDMTTGAGTPVASAAGRYVNVPTLSPAGTLFAWSKGPATPDRLVIINKVTGIATIVGNPQLQALAHSLAFDTAGRLWLLNDGGNLYRIDPTTAVATLQGVVSDLPHTHAHHGAINPGDGLLYGLTSKDGETSPSLAVIDLEARSIVRTAAVDGALHTLAWVMLPSRLTVMRNGSGSGSVASSDTYIACGATCTHTYIGGSQVTLTATADAGSVFTGWLGACTGTGPCSLTLNTDATVTATFATPANIADRPLDIDNNNARDALTDGLILIRRMFGLTGGAMIARAIGPNAQRSDPVAIASYIVDVNPKFDVDGNGQVDALTDGVLILRYLFGVRGNALIANAIGPGATRSTIVTIESYLQSIAQ